MTTNMKRTMTAAVLAVVMVAAGTGTAWAQARWARVNGFSDAFWTVFGYRGQVVTVNVSGDGDTDLDLYVYDDGGRLIVSDEELDDQPVVSFEVYRSSKFTIKVKNRGRVYNEYQIWTSIR